MLAHLSIRNVVLIEKLDLSFASGLCVLTGETGAGKSILLDSLSLALGDRVRSGMIRGGANQASVTASFDAIDNVPLHAFLAALGLANDDLNEPIVFQRVVTVDGRSRAFINGAPTTQQTLRQASNFLIEIQGQHAHLALFEPTTQRDLLDQYGVSPSQRERASKAYRTFLDAKTRLAQAKNEASSALAEEEWLEHCVADLRKLAVEDDEEEKLASIRAQCQKDEKRLEAVRAAMRELSPTDRRTPSPSQLIRNANRALGRILTQSEDGPSPVSSKQQRALDAATALENAETALLEAEEHLSRLSMEIEVDPKALESTEERLFSLRAAGRKYDVAVAELPALAASFEERLEALNNSQENILRRTQEYEQSWKDYNHEADKLSAERRKAALRLETAIQKELPPLKLAQARFHVNINALTEERWTENGKENIVFCVTTNPDQPPGPIQKIASGGELSRFMLALRVVLAGTSDVSTLIFDEVDAGIGGATASAIGERLHQLGQAVQVLVVTHSPQVAARGDHHFRISKIIEKQRTETIIALLNGEERQEEVARMLAGEIVTDAARRAAQILLD